MSTKKEFKRELFKIILITKGNCKIKKEVDLECFIMKIKMCISVSGKEIR